jgi:hypothetical protein
LSKKIRKKIRKKRKARKPPPEVLYIRYSLSGATIRLPRERWNHITKEHPIMHGHQAELVDALQHPEDNVIYRDSDFSLRAFKWSPRALRHIMVVYRENNGKGFVITCYPISDPLSEVRGMKPLRFPVANSMRE